jgi:preprotein translocase subunit SecG
MYDLLLVLHVLIALMLVGLILIQQGKGAQAGASFGSGASQTVFGSQGSGGFISRTTGVLAALFFILNLFLAYYINKTSFREAPPAPVSTQAEGNVVPQENEKSSGSVSGTQPPVGKDVPDVP